MTGSYRSKRVKLTAALLACVGVWAHAQDDLGDIDALLLDLGGGAKPKAAPAVPAVAAPAPEADIPAVGGAVPAEAVAVQPLPANEPKTAAAPADVAAGRPPAEAAVAPEKPLVAVAAEPTPAEAAPAPEMPLIDGSVPAMPDVLSTPASREAVISELATLERMRREAKIRQGENELASARDDMTKGMYDDAKRKYSNALSYIPDTPDTRESRIAAEKGLADAHYQHALLLRKKGLLEQALAEARAAQGKGQAQADRLVGMIRKDMEIPPRKAETVEIPRMSQLEFKENREKVAVRMRRARQHYVVGEYAKARDEAELVVKEEPFNVEAIRLLRRIAERMNDIATQEQLTTRERMLRDVSAAWTPDRYGVDAAFSVDLKPKTDDLTRTSKAPEKGLSPEQEIQKKMQAIMIPSIQFNAANITDVISFFEKASREYDTEKATEKRGVNFVIKTGAGTAPASGGAAATTDLFTPAATGGGVADSLGAGPITFSARYVTLYDALKTVMDVSNMKFRIKGNIVTIMPMNIADDILITRSYNVLPTLTERVLSTHREIAPAGDGNGGFAPTAEMSAATDWKGFFGQMGVNWPEGSAISYLATIGKLRVSNTADNLANFEQVLEELNVTPRQIEVEARFVEVAQEDLNSLGFDWILNGNLGVNTGIGALDKFTSLPPTTLDPLNPLSGPSLLRPFDSGSLIVDGGGSGGSWANTLSGGTTDPFTGLMTGQTRQWQWNPTPPANSYGRGMRFLNSAGNGVLNAGTTKQDDLLKLTAGLDGNAISMILHALSQKTSTDVLSAPKVVTKSGQEAIMKVVTEYIYPTSFEVASTPGVAAVGGAPAAPGATTVSPSDFETRDVGVILQVLPEVSADGQMINLMMNPQIVSPPEWKNYGSKIPQYTQVTETSPLPPFTTTTRTVLLTDSKGNPIYLEQPMEQPLFKIRSISTSISIYNGATVVMGGMITEERVATFDKIPFLGDIPYLGRLFQSKGERTEKRNLLIFVTARLVDPAGRVVRTSGEEKLFTGLPEALPSTPATP